MDVTKTEQVATSERPAAQEVEGMAEMMEELTKLKNRLEPKIGQCDTPKVTQELYDLSVEILQKSAEIQTLLNLQAEHPTYVLDMFRTY